MKKICIAIVTYNAADWIDYFMSGFSNISSEFQVVVCDNNSKDNTVELLQKRADIFLIINKRNLGFGKANNLIFKYAIDNKFDFIFLLNQDAKISTKEIYSLINISLKYPEYAILSPIHLNGNGNKIDEIFKNVLCMQTERDFINDLFFKEKLKEVYTANNVNAAGWLLPIKTIKEVGFFDELYPHYGEDNDFCNRVVFTGAKIGICPNIFLYHNREGRIESKRNKVHRLWMSYTVMTTNPNNDYFRNFLHCNYNLLLCAVKNPKYYLKIYVNYILNTIRMYRSWKRNKNLNKF